MEIEPSECRALLQNRQNSFEQNELSGSGRATQPEEITSVIAFLASDDASVVMAEICP
jgi:hypothetical protein